MRKLVEVNPEAPGLLPWPRIMICDSTGVEGEIAVLLTERNAFVRYLT